MYRWRRRRRCRWYTHKIQTGSSERQATPSLFLVKESAVAAHMRGTHIDSFPTPTLLCTTSCVLCDVQFSTLQTHRVDKSPLGGANYSRKFLKFRTGPFSVSSINPWPSHTAKVRPIPLALPWYVDVCPGSVSQNSAHTYLFFSFGPNSRHHACTIFVPSHSGCISLVRLWVQSVGGSERVVTCWG